MIVMDATVAVKMLTLEPGAEATLARVADEEDRLAPDWLRIEVANALSKKVRNDDLPEAAARAALSALNDIVTQTFPAIELLEDALTLSLRLNHTVYDCVYLALALRHEALVLTHDVQFSRRAVRAGHSRNMELLA